MGNKPLTENGYFSEFPEIYFFVLERVQTCSPPSFSSSSDFSLISPICHSRKIRLPSSYANGNFIVGRKIAFSSM
jgi:hypothetical protein